MQQTSSTPAVSTKEFKILLLGAEGVGKTEFARQHLLRQQLPLGMYTRCLELEDEPTPTACPTIYPLQRTAIASSDPRSRIPVVIHLWEIAGTTVRRFLPSYLKDADATILMFDLTNPPTMGVARVWKEEAERANPGIPMILLGHKCDKVQNLSGNLEIDYEILPELTDLDFLYCSSVSGYNLKRPLNRLLEILLEKEKWTENTQEGPQTPEMPHKELLPPPAPLKENKKKVRRSLDFDCISII